MRTVVLLLLVGVVAAQGVAEAVQRRMTEGSAHYTVGRYDAALVEFRKAAAMDPRSVEARLWVGHTRYMQRDYEGAIAEYTTALAVDPGHIGSLYARGLARQLLHDHKSAIADFTEIVALKRTHALAWLKRGDSRRELLDFAGAVEDYGNAIYINPGDKNVRAAYEGRAQVNQDLGNYEAAQHDYTTLIDMYPNWAVPWRKRARVRAFLKDRKGSNADFEAAIFAAANDSANFTERARVRKLQGDYAGAVVDCDKAVKLDPKNYHPYFIRGLVHYDFGNYRKARLDLLKAIKRAPGEPDYTHLYMCLTYRRMRQPERAVDELQAYVASKNEKLDAWYASVVKFLTGEIEEDAFLDSARDETPKKTNERRCEAYFYAATLRAVAKDKEGAHALYKKCVATRVRSFIEYESATIALGE